MHFISTRIAFFFWPLCSVWLSFKFILTFPIQNKTKQNKTNKRPTSFSDNIITLITNTTDLVTRHHYFMLFCTQMPCIITQPLHCYLTFFFIFLETKNVCDLDLISRKLQSTDAKDLTIILHYYMVFSNPFLQRLCPDSNELIIEIIGYQKRKH